MEKWITGKLWPAVNRVSINGPVCTIVRNNEAHDFCFYEITAAVELRRRSVFLQYTFLVTAKAFAESGNIVLSSRVASIVW